MAGSTAAGRHGAGGVADAHIHKLQAERELETLGPVWASDPQRHPQ